MASAHLIAHRFEDKERSNDVRLEDNLDFSALMLSPLVQDGLTKSGFVKPSPIQLQAIPLGKFGLDLIVQAKSGTGKTCIFAVVALENIILECSSVQTLVLAPTREIASQICDVILSIGSCMPSFNCHYFIGGLPLATDILKLKKCQIAVGTPGRIKQLIELKYLNTSFIRLFVLDEADKLLDKNFKQSINWIYGKLPHNKQMLALSATYPESLAKLLLNYMRNPAFVRLNTHKPALLGVIQFYTVTKFHPLSHVTFQHKLKVLSDILTNIPFSQTLIFINLQSRAQLLCDKLNKQGWASTYICGNQDQVQRLRTMAQLKSFHCRILVTTDLTARGIDCQNVDVIINVDLPVDLETYLHRIGRAGRFGSKGLAITIISEGNEKDKLLSMNLLASLDIRELPKPISAKVWNSNIKEDVCCNSESSNTLTKTNDSLICILDDDLFNNEKKNVLDKTSNDTDSDQLKTLIYSEHINVSNAQCHLIQEDKSDSNNKCCLRKVDAIYNSNNNEHCKLPYASSNENLEEETLSIPNTTQNLQQYSILKNCYPCDQEQTRLVTNGKKLESPREMLKCLNEVLLESANTVIDISSQSIGNSSFQEESNKVNKVDDFSQFYRLKSNAQNISYTEVVKELDSFDIESKYHKIEQCKECVPSEKLLQESKIVLDHSNSQHWKHIETATRNNNVVEHTKQESALFQKVCSSSLSEVESIKNFPNEIMLFSCKSPTEEALTHDDCEIINAKTVPLLEETRINCDEIGNELLHKTIHTVTEQIEIDVTRMTTAAGDISVEKLKRSDSNQTTSNSSDIQLQLIDDDLNVDSDTTDGCLTDDTSNSFSLQETEVNVPDEKLCKNVSLLKSCGLIDDNENIHNSISKNCQVSAHSLRSDDESYYSCSSYSESEENTLGDAGNYNGHVSKWASPFETNYNSLHVLSEMYTQKKECEENAKEISFSNYNGCCTKCFPCGAYKETCERLPFTPDCWQQSDYGYCTAQAEHNYRQLFCNQNCYIKNATYRYHNLHENKPHCMFPSKICGKVSQFNNCVCKYCYWQQCSSYSQAWYYQYTMYMSEMLKWRKSQKHCIYKHNK